LPRIVADTPIGKKVDIQVLRQGRKQILHIVVARLDDGTARRAVGKAPPRILKSKSKIAQLGFSLGMLDAAARAQFHISGNVRGVVITAVDPDSVAGQKNFRPGDVIVEVRSHSVRTPDDVARRVEADVKAGQKVELLLVNRGGDLTYVGLKLR
jgi:serine protease Do